MDCETVERENIVERYLEHTLDPQLKEQWELHYFGCDRCAEMLATWQTIAGPLRQKENSIRREMAPRRNGLRWLWAGAAVAAAVVIGFVMKSPAVPEVKRTAEAPVASPVKRDWTEVARFDPPSYVPSTLRAAGSPAELRFQAAMETYLQRDYSQAAAGLRSSLELDPSAPAARFFLGACDLLTNDTAGAIREWQRVTSGNSPFVEEAQFDLSKAYLRLGDEERALTILRKLSGSEGEYREPARQLMARIASIP